MAALREVARGGGLTIAAVSRAAEVTRATFYNHFGSLEEAAWVAMLDSFEKLLAEDTAARRDGADPAAVGVGSLRRIVELLRADGELALVADSYRRDSTLPGLADIVLDQIRRTRIEFGATTAFDADAEDVFTAAGLYALLSTGAKGDGDAADVASVAYSLLPEWMRPPRS